MKNELLQIKRIFALITQQCNSGITFDDLMHESDYSLNDVKSCVALLQKAGLAELRADNNYYPTGEALKIAANNWHLTE